MKWLIGFGILVAVVVLLVFLAALASRRDWKSAHRPESDPLFTEDDRGTSG